MKIKHLKEQPLLNPPGLTVGLPEITLEDRQTMLRYLEELRQTAAGRGLAEHLFHLKELGIRQPIASGDREAMARELKEARDKHNVGWVTLQLYFMQELGLPQAATDSERKLLAHHAGWRRQVNGGNIDVSMSAKGREVWAHDPFTPNDLETLKELLTYYREKRDGFWLAKIHYYISKIKPPEDSQRTQMPPIKKFEK